MEDEIYNSDDVYVSEHGDDTCGNCGESVATDFNSDYFCRACGAALCFDCLQRYGSTCSHCSAPFSVEDSFISIPGLE